ncbi:hypothetical protein AVEN_197507-1 [Araneus ventricosus]|uniref:Uncharacterized protein n=1 Tax=Araneus ventricosus TaxID=182803 RepID=A0A4Y2BRI5_ARAVE|nr:hypothetical protein AVEN_197507-1 [Araneus ventricosus]
MKLPPSLHNHATSGTLQSSNWIRENTIFFSEYGPFPAYLHRFGLINNNFCTCGEIGTALHYATECILTSSCHMRKPKTDLLQEWLKRDASNALSIHNTMKCMRHNGHIFLPTT